MNPIAVLFAPGFEEAEALTIVDILRRAHLPAETVGVSGPEVTGGHGITLKTDKTLNEVSADGLEMVVIPGGYPGVDRLLESEETLALLREMDARGKWLAAICAGPRVLDRAGVLAGKRYTAYPGQEDKITTGAYCKELVVRDGNILTSRGPATVYAFAYALVDALGGDSLAVKNRMVYFNAFKEGESHA